MGDDGNALQLLTKKGLINFSVQHVIAEYLDCRETLETYADRGKLDPEKQRVITQCKQKLEETREALMPAKWWKCRKVFVAWRLIHRMGEDFILLMNCEELAAQGHKILHDLKTSPLPDIVRLDWISQVDEKLKKLDAALQEANTRSHAAMTAASKNAATVAPQPHPCVDRGTAQLFRTVTNIINDSVDDRFWELWSSRFLLLIYVILLALGLGWLLWQLDKPGGFSLHITGVLILGAMGGIASGIMTTEQEYMAKGHFWLPVFSCPAVRVIQGALAAMIVFWMIQCHYLIRIDPPLERYNKAYLCMTSPVWKDPAYQRNSPRERAVHKHQFANHSSAKRDPMLDLNAPPGKQIYLYFLVLFAAGFMGDKILKFLSDKVTSRLFAEAEKTKEPKK
jgi:hypothetical protein